MLGTPTGVLVGVAVGVAVRVAVAVLVGVAVRVGVADGVGVEVRVGVDVRVGVGVSVGAHGGLKCTMVPFCPAAQTLNPLSTETSSRLRCVGESTLLQPRPL